MNLPIEWIDIITNYMEDEDIFKFKGIDNLCNIKFKLNNYYIIRNYNNYGMKYSFKITKFKNVNYGDILPKYATHLIFDNDFN
jgi:hypothetical protein